MLPSQSYDNQAAADPAVVTDTAVPDASGNAEQPPLSQQQGLHSPVNDVESPTGSDSNADDNSDDNNTRPHSAALEDSAQATTTAEVYEPQQVQAEGQSASSSPRSVPSQTAAAVSQYPDESLNHELHMQQQPGSPQQKATGHLDNGNAEPAHSQSSDQTASEHDLNEDRDHNENVRQVNGMETLDATNSREDVRIQAPQEPMPPAHQTSPGAVPPHSTPGKQYSSITMTYKSVSGVSNCE